EVAARWGNQLGKTACFAYLCSVFATGLYPAAWKGRRFDGPTDEWIAGESTTAVRDVAQDYLIGNDTDPGFIPPDRIAKIVRGHGAGEGVDLLRVKHTSGGFSEIGFKSYDMERTKLQGKSLQWIWCDEEPPLDIYLEMLARLIATDGLAMSSFTPLSGFGRIIPRFSERSIEAVRHRILIPGRMDEFPQFQDPEKRARLLSTFPEHQRRARIDGLPLLGSGAVFEDVQFSDIVAPFKLIDGRVVHKDQGEFDKSGLAWIWGIDFGIAHPFAAVLCAWDRDYDVIYVMGELKIKGAIPAQHASRMKAITRNIGDVRVAWPHDGAQHDRGSGQQLASIYKAEGLNMMASHATHKDGGFSTEAGIVEMLARMRDGRLKVAPNLTEWQEEFESYHRKDGLIVKEGDDLMSATRMAVMQIRSAKPTVSAPGRGEKGKSKRWTADQFYLGID
ncbi:MAG TPA: terminase family protein, partial [Stellaceae bacterium]|nr:terminase family protein [Stellaceae bacterium]